jgi:hypothetical protein
LRLSDAESRLYIQSRGRPGKTTTSEHKLERREEWYGSWSSEEESGVEGGVKPVYAELALPLVTMLNCEAFECGLDEHL